MATRAGGTLATMALTTANIAFTLHPYEYLSGPTHHYGDEAAQALGIDPRRLFKTLVAEAEGRLAVAVVPVAGSLDLKALATALGAKRASMADPTTATRSSGYVLGGISPIGQRTRLRTVIDISARDCDTVLVSAGKRGLQVELAPQDLAAISRAIFAPVAISPDGH